MQGTCWLLAICLCAAASYGVRGSQVATDGAAVRDPHARLSGHCNSLQHQVKVTAADQQTAVSALLGRLLPAEAAAAFKLRIDCHEADSNANGCDGGFTVACDGDSVLVAGGSGVDLAAGAYWFLKYRCSDGLCMTVSTFVICASTMQHTTTSQKTALGRCWTTAIRPVFSSSQHPAKVMPLTL
jgi:hypothetical protein